MKPLRTIGFFFLIVLAVILIGPLVIPIPPLAEPLPLSELVDADSRFIEVNGIDVHYKQAGSGEPVMILLHGFGASTYSWREVIQPLAEHGTVIAFDRPGFGLTERPMPGEWKGESPYSPKFQIELTIGLMDRLGIQQAVLIGNSAGGTVSMAAALEYPQRVSALVLVSPAIYAGGGAPGWVRPLLRTQHFERLGPWFARSLAGEQGDAFLIAAWHDPAKLSDEIIANYRKPLQVANWDRALWELTKASRESGLGSRLAELNLPVLVASGDDDRIVPTEESTRLASEIPGAELAVFEGCGHLPQEECPQPFLNATIQFLSAIKGEQGQ
ncbi:MAG: alpha/beta hydrolase [Bellilinea sp.]|jgi:pimeloyl-ACP methyl ester carboxylesterase